MVIFQEICDPGYAKKVKKFQIFEKRRFFSLETTLNALKFVRNTICAVHDKFQAGISLKKVFQEICDPVMQKKSFFKKSVTLDMQKKSKKSFQFLKKKSQKISNFWNKFFSLNALKFVRNTICAVHDKFQAGISQKSS